MNCKPMSEIIRSIIRITVLGIILCVSTTISVAQYWASCNLWDGEALYTDHLNQIEISAGSSPNSDLNVTVDRGLISGTMGVYTYQVAVAGPMMLYITKGRDTLIAKKYLVRPFPKPKLCIMRGNPRKLEPQDFAYGVWSPNPLDRFQRLAITKIQIDYMDLGGQYVNSVIAEGDDIKNPYAKLGDIRAKKIWIEQFSYKAFDGSIKTVRSPELCNCAREDRNFLPNERFTQELPTTKERRAIEVFFYPRMIATINGKTFGPMDAPGRNTVPPIVLRPQMGTNTYGFKVVGFTLRILTTNGMLMSYVSPNGGYTPEMTAALSALRVGDRFEISDIDIDNGLKKTQASRLSFTIN